MVNDEITCPHCNEIETREHVITTCPIWEPERRRFLEDVEDLDVRDNFYDIIFGDLECITFGTEERKEYQLDRSRKWFIWKIDC